MGGETLKRAHEQGVAERFLLNYRHMTGCALFFASQGERPDALCRDPNTGELVGLEIRTAYYDEGHAKADWAGFRGHPHLGYMLNRPDQDEDQRALAMAVKILRAKAEKPRSHYQVRGQLWLVICLLPWRLNIEDRRIRAFLDQASPQARNPFDAIFFLSDTDGLYRMWPEPRWLRP